MAKRITKTYDQEFKSQAVKLAQEISIPSGTIYAWVGFQGKPFRSKGRSSYSIQYIIP